MKRWPVYRIHKWFAVTVGVFLLAWLASGIIMVLPPISPGPDPIRQAATVDFRDVTQSPAQAVANLEKALGTPSQVSSVSLKRIQDIVVYEIRSRNDDLHLINAVSGRLFSITRDQGERYVLDTYPRQGRVQRTEMVKHHSYAYQWGPLPAFRIVLDSDPSVDFYVSVEDGTVRRIDRWNRLLNALASLHTFQPLKLITRRDEVRRGLMIVAGIMGIGAAVTGYYLSVRRR